MGLGKALLEGGGKAASFEEIGDSVEGVVISAEMRQATDLETGKPGYWDNGDPKQNAIVTIQTKDRDPSIPEDDGVRSVYIKWWGSNKIALQQTIRQSTAGLPEEQQDILKGGYFKASLVDKLPPQTRGFSPTKVHAYEYRPPAGGLGKALTANGGGRQVDVKWAAQEAPQPYVPPVTTPEQPAQPQLPVQQPEAPATPPPTTAPADDPMAIINRIKTLAAPPISMDAIAISELVPQYSPAAIQAILGV